MLFSDDDFLCILLKKPNIMLVGVSENFDIYISVKCNTHSHMLEPEHKKSHTCEEGRAHLRISFLYLLMGLKNK